MGGLVVVVLVAAGAAALSGCDVNAVKVNSVADVTATTAVLNAYLDVGAPVAYHFQYGLTASYGRVTPTATLPAGFKNEVRAVVTGLTSHTTYHDRLCVTPPHTHMSCYPDQTFKTSTPSNTPIVMLIHGGGFTGGTPTDAYVTAAETLFTAQHVAWLALDYPTADGNPVEAETEAQRVVAALTGDGHRVYVFGWSAGATIALWLATHNDVAAAAAMAGPTDLWAWNSLLKAPGWTHINADAASPALHLRVSETVAPILILHARDDTIVPYAQTIELMTVAAAHAISPQPQLVTYDTGNHGIINQRAPNSRAEQWLANQIIKPTTTTTTTTSTTEPTMTPTVSTTTTLNP
jgi:acetyl esterase/lipase